MTEIEKIKAGVALLPKLKNDLRCLVTNDALPAQTQPIAAIIAALEAAQGLIGKPLIEGGGVDRNAVLEEVAAFIDGFDTNFTRQKFGEPYVRKTEIVASVRALKDALSVPAVEKEGVVDHEKRVTELMIADAMKIAYAEGHKAAIEEAAKLCDESFEEAKQLREVSPDEKHRISRTSWVNTSQMLAQQIRALTPGETP